MSRDALIVGINTYKHLPALRAPALDAEAIAQQLQTHGEFRVHRLPEVIQAGQPGIGGKTSVTLRDLETALVNLFKPKSSNVPHTALFYFSGHGIQKEAGIQEGYLAVSDSNPEVGFYGLSLFWLRRLLQESPVRQRIIWLDCCHSGELLNFLEADPGARSGTDRLFMAASRDYEAAYESLDSPHSVFTQALLAGLDPHREASGIITNHSLTAWVSQSLSGEIQQPLFENSGSEIILMRRSGPPTQVKEPITSDICPYRGLEFFDEDHAEYFFGREDLTDQLIEKLRSGRFIAVAGASGSGKSSLVRAGLIWELRRGQVFSGSDRWRIKLLTPTEYPLRSLAAAFINPDLTELERAEHLRRAETFLKDGGNGLAQLVRASLPIEPGTTGLTPKARPQLLLVIDQFEEVFTLCGGPKAEQERQQFFNCLIGALSAAGDCLNIVIVLRADFIGKCSLYENLAQQIERNLVMVTPLNYEQIKATITRPAQKVGLVCESNLVYTMLLDLIGAPGELPLLQYTLMELWQRRRLDAQGGPARLTLDTYTELGGVRGTLQKRATEIFYSLTVEEQAVAKRIFLALTQLGEGTEDTRRRILKTELVSSAFTLELVERALEKLVAAKLIVTNREKPIGLLLSQDKSWDFAPPSAAQNPNSYPSSFSGKGVGEFGSSGEPPQGRSIAAVSQLSLTATFCCETIDVAHEALIRNWSLLRNWLDENREMLQRQRWIERAAQEWDIVGRPTGLEYLLRGGRLADAEDFVSIYPHELSILAQHYVLISQKERHRTKQKSRLLQTAVPSVLLIALAMTFNQYRSALQTQAEKDYQLQIATSRERAAIAQSILQEPNSDPMTALLISRLAAEQGGATYEAQSSLRAALRSLRLQIELQGHQGDVHQIAFSPQQNYVATASADSTIRLWSLDEQTIYLNTIKPSYLLSWQGDETGAAAAAPANITQMALSANGNQVAAIAQGVSTVKVWSAETGKFLFRLDVSTPPSQVAFSPDNRWIATLSGDQTISLWRADTGQWQATLPIQSAVSSIQFNPKPGAAGQMLLSAGKDGVARVWQLHEAANRALKVSLVRSLLHTAALNSAQFSPTGRWIATAAADGTAHVWNTSTGQPSQVFPKAQPQSSVSQAVAPSLVPTAMLPVSGRPQSLQQVTFSPDEQILAIADVSDRVELWNLGTGQPQMNLLTALNTPLLVNQGMGSQAIAFSPDSRLIATVSRTSADQGSGYVTHLWDIYSGKEIGALQDHAGKISAVQFSPDGAYVATSTTSGMVRFWAAKEGGELPTVAIPNSPTRWTAFIPNLATDTASSYAAVASVTRLPHVSNQETSQTQAIAPLSVPPAVPPTSSPATAQASLMAAVTSSSANMVTVASDGTLRHWRIWADEAMETATAENTNHTNHLLRHTPIDTQSVWQWLFSILPQPRSTPKPHQPLWAIPEGLVKLQQSSLMLDGIGLTTPQERAIASTKAPLTSFALSPDGQVSAVATADGWLELYQEQAGQAMKRLHRWQNFEGIGANGSAPGTANQTVSPVQQLTFSPDGQQLLGVRADFTVCLWDVQTGQLIRVFQGHQATIEDAQFSPDGQRIVTASWDKTVHIWQPHSGQLVRTIPHADGVSSARFSPDGKRIATASWDGNAQILDAATGASQIRLTGHRDAVLSIDFSPDGRSLVTASEDGTARLWDAQTGMEQAQLRPTALGDPSLPIRRAFFSPDGQYIATLAEDGQIYLWAATWQALLDLARDRSLRQLTPEECNRYLRVVADQCPTLDLRN